MIIEQTRLTAKSIDLSAVVITIPKLSLKLPNIINFLRLLVFYDGLRWTIAVVSNGLKTLLKIIFPSFMEVFICRYPENSNSTKN